MKMEMFFREKLMSPHQLSPTPWIATSAFAPANIVIQDFG